MWKWLVVGGCLAYIIFFFYKVVVFVRWATHPKGRLVTDEFEETVDNHAKHLR